MSLTLIAEILAGETLVSPGGAVDAMTVLADDPRLWGSVAVNSALMVECQDPVVALSGSHAEAVPVPI